MSQAPAHCRPGAPASTSSGNVLAALPAGPAQTHTCASTWAQGLHRSVLGDLQLGSFCLLVWLPPFFPPYAGAGVRGRPSWRESWKGGGEEWGEEIAGIAVGAA